MVVLRGDDERRRVLDVDRVDVDAALEEELDDVGAPLRRRPVDGLHARGGDLHIQLHVLRDEALEHIEAAEERRPVRRRRAVLRVGAVHRLWELRDQRERRGAVVGLDRGNKHVGRRRLDVA